MLHLLDEIYFPVIVFRVSVVDEDGIASFVPYSSGSPNILLKLQEVGRHRGNDHMHSPARLDVMIRWEVHAPALILGYDKNRVSEAACRGKGLHHCRYLDCLTWTKIFYPDFQFPQFPDECVAGLVLNDDDWRFERSLFSYLQDSVSVLVHRCENLLSLKDRLGLKQAPQCQVNETTLQKF